MNKNQLWKIDGFNVEYFDAIDSTNAECRRRLEKLKDFEPLNKTVLVAAMQTAGRGRLNRKFYSPAKTGLYFSLIYTDGDFSFPASVTASAAVAVCKAIKDVYNLDCSIKWVNDVFCNGKKICGILTEGLISQAQGKIGAVIIGIGINLLWNSEIPEDLHTFAGSLLQDNLKDNSFEEKKIVLFKKIVLYLCNILDNFEKEQKSVFEEYKNRSNLIGRRIEISPIIGNSENNYFCTVEDISSNANLVVRTDDGILKELNSGEVTLHSSLFQ